MLFLVNENIYLETFSKVDKFENAVFSQHGLWKQRLWNTVSHVTNSSKMVEDIVEQLFWTDRNDAEAEDGEESDILLMCQFRDKSV